MQKVSLQLDQCCEPNNKTCMKKVSIQCERCRQPYKKICPKDITCNDDLKVGICKECKTDVALEVAKYAQHPEYILWKLQRFKPSWVDESPKEYKTICDTIPTP